MVVWNVDRLISVEVIFIDILNTNVELKGSSIVHSVTPVLNTEIIWMFTWQRKNVKVTQEKLFRL